MIIGGVVGDALGTTLEFSQNPSADRRTWHTKVTSDGPFNLPVGGWTDDTSMMLALMDAYLNRGFLDANYTANNFLARHRDAGSVAQV